MAVTMNTRNRDENAWIASPRTENDTEPGHRN